MYAESADPPYVWFDKAFWDATWRELMTSTVAELRTCLACLYSGHRWLIDNPCYQLLCALHVHFLRPAPSWTIKPTLAVCRFAVRAINAYIWPCRWI
jgi:hypothetical protein